MDGGLSAVPRSHVVLVPADAAVVRTGLRGVRAGFRGRPPCAPPEPRRRGAGHPPEAVKSLVLELRCCHVPRVISATAESKAMQLPITIWLGE